MAAAAGVKSRAPFSSTTDGGHYLTLATLTKTLLDLGVDFSDPNAQCNRTKGLPLEPFDVGNELEDVFLMSIPQPNAQSVSKTYRPLRAFGLVYDEADMGHWRPCFVLQYNRRDRTLIVEWEETRTKMMLRRLQCVFWRENVVAFAARLSHALQTRKEAESFLRYNLYIDNMPTDEVPPLPEEKIDRILHSALNIQRVVARNPDTGPLLHEITTDYARTLNKIIFDINLHDPKQKDVFAHLELPPMNIKPPAPYLGVISVPKYDFAGQSASFYEKTHLGEVEVIRALNKVRNECNKVLALPLFQTDIFKTSVLVDFQRLQSEASKFAAQTLKRGWFDAIRSAVLGELSGAANPDLDPDATDKVAYDRGKLRRVLGKINYMMESTIRTLTELSLQQYTDFIKEVSSYRVTVIDTKNIDVFYRHPTIPHITERTPLFSVEIQLREGAFVYNTSPEQFEMGPVSHFDEALGQLHDIPQLEPAVMQKLYLGKRKYLSFVTDSEPLVIDLRHQIVEALLIAVEPLRKYIHTYDQYLEFLNMDVEAYVTAYKEKGAGLDEDQKEIKSILAKRSQVETQVPAQVNVGMFLVNCQGVRDSLIQKYDKFVHLILSMVHNKAQAAARNLCQKYDEIFGNLSKVPTNIEQLCDLREYLKSIPEETTPLESDIKNMLSEYDVLDMFSFQLSDEAFKDKWSAFGWPNKLAEKIRDTEAFLTEEQSKFQKDMMADQEQFIDELNRLDQVVNGFSRHADIAKIGAIANQVRDIQDQIKACEEKAKKFNAREVLFGLEVSEYERLGKMSKSFEPYVQLWVSADDWRSWHSSWMSDPFEGLDAESMDKDLTNAWRNIMRAQKAFAEMPALLQVATTIKAELDEFKPIMPLVSALRQPGLRDRHWDQMSKDLGFALKPGESLNSLQDVLDLDLMKHFENLQKTCDIASKEYAIERALDKMQDEWQPLELQIVAYRETGTFVLKGSDELQQLLDDHIVMTQAMSFSSFKKPHEERLRDWEKKLSSMSEIIDEWLNCQKNWMYLEPIFSSEDIMRQLPTEGQRFKTVDRHWRKRLGVAHDEPNVLRFTDSEGLLETFQSCNLTLEQVQKGLNDYLETKRQAFARFYFLSNDELLEILSQTRDPKAVQPHLRKCFEAISKVEFTPDLQMISMYSGEGEQVPWVDPVIPEGPVESWLGEVEKMMIKSLAHQIVASAQAYKQVSRRDWILQWAGQVVLCVDQIYWTDEATTAIEKNKLDEYHQQCHKQLLEITELVRGELSNMQRITLGAVITIDVHARDVIQNMVIEKVRSTQDFEWIAQLRYYLEEGRVIVRQVESPFKYAYEYLGNSMRLVITPLTDKIYLTLTGALALLLGGAPAGPAGTGKTETVKDLSKAMGLAMSGAWACFDEFNRIDIEVLSVIAQQLLTIQRAAIAHAERFMFEGVEIRLDPTNASFITMNPGYAGRTELPDNLKALFRPVACMVPDYALIGEIRLFSFGFKEARSLANKMVATFRLSSEQLSSQDHYDFGMRAVNTVIAAAGLLKRDSPDAVEELLLLRALRDSNLPKFLSDDITLFNGIISDLFPGVKLPESDYGSLMQYLRKAVVESGLQPVDNFIVKCIQLYDVTVLRHGLMLVGPTGGGKTSACRSLKLALNMLHKEKNTHYEVKTLICNPKAITMGQLYGQFDEATHEWTDGILCTLFRDAVRDPKPRQKWLVFDGPVDALWIESMNTVLDENKKLCLVSGEIITMTSWMRMFFEVEDLSVASPATVSRCGMIYMEPFSCVGTAALVASWLQTVPDSVKIHADHIQSLCEKFLDDGTECVRRQCTEYVGTVNPNLVASFFRIMDGFWKLYVPEEPGGSLDALKTTQLAANIEPLFFFSLVWSLGASVDGPSRLKFDSWLRNHRAKIGGSAKPEAFFPGEGLVYDWCFIPDADSSNWKKWIATIPASKVDPKAKFAEIIVPTTDSIRYTYFVRHLLKQLKHVLCVGPTGTGKTLVAKELLARNMPEEFLPVFVTFSAQTTANQTQDILDGRMDKRRKGVYGPPSGKNFVIFVDDLNMPAREKYFAQPPIELLRQWMDHEGWYDRKTMQIHQLVDICFIGAMGPPGGGRNPVTNRYLRHFNHMAFVELGDESLTHIFRNIAKAHCEAFLPEAIQSLVDATVASSIQVYQRCCAELLPTPARSHYTFNLRDLAKVFQGMLMADPKRISDGREVWMRLWAHECQRVFRDRLIDSQDRGWFDDLLKQQMKEIFKTEWSNIVPADNRIMFGDYLNRSLDPRPYSEIRDWAELRRVIESYLEDFNTMTNKPMKLVMFLDAIDHVSKIARILRQPRGNALLLGVGGSGRQSLTRLAASICDCDLMQIEITKGYGRVEWRDDVKKALLRAGCEGKPIVFLFSDTQIVMESCLEDINNVLNSGEVPNIFDLQDQDQIFQAVRPVVQAKGLQPTKFIVHETFLQRVQENLHMTLAFSPIGDSFRNRLRQFPSLVTCCTIDWFSEWPEEALRSVATEKFADVDLGAVKIQTGIIEMCRFIHQSVERKSEQYLHTMRRYNYVTPTSYLELLGTYSTLLEMKRDELATAKRRLLSGLDKLSGTEVEVEVLQKELVRVQPVLEETVKQVSEMMVQIEADKESAAKTKAVVVVEEAAASKKAAECEAIKAGAEAELAEALPALDAAVAVLKNLKLTDISEVAKYANPPQLVKLVVEGICVMRQIEPARVGEAGKKVDDYWAPGKKMLQDPKGLLDAMFAYDKDHIPPRVISKVQPIIDNPDFDPKKIDAVSKACTAMCQWVKAMHLYYHVALNVEPKRMALKQAESELGEVSARLRDWRSQLKEVEDRLADLEAKFAAGVQKKEELAKQKEDCNIKLDRADRLLGGLGGEKARWKATVAELEALEANVIGDIMIASGGIAYLGAFTASFRDELEKEWAEKLRGFEVLISNNAGVRNTLADPVAIRAWTISGLPTDNLSIENAIIMSKSRRWPLMIDPQGQANKWVKNREKDKNLDVVKLSDKDLLRTLCNGVRFGKPVLLENVAEELDPSIEPVLLKQIFKQGGTDMIKIGDEIIPYHPDFQFFITTKLPNPHYPPETCVKVTLLNFTVNLSGLEDQLLGIVVSKERPDLEEMKNQLVVANAKMRKELKDIEDTILKLLADSEGNILDDDTLITTLAQSKETSQEINEKVKEAETTEKQIDETRNRFRTVAFRGSLLFFSVADMATVDPMYQFSLQWFIDLFVRGIEDSPSADDIEVRCNTLNDFFTFSLYKNICRGLFEKHKLLFSFTLCIRIMMGQNQIRPDEWRFLLTGATGNEMPIPNPAPSWLTEKSWLDILYLSKLQHFKGLDQSVNDNIKEFQGYFDSNTCHEDPLPAGWDAKLDPMQKMLVLRCFRSDKLEPAIANFISGGIGAQFIDPPVFSLSAAFDDSAPTIPLIFVLTAGADPVAELLKFAGEMGFGETMQYISLGQGQGPIAEKMILNSAAEGHWVLLQNCHLAVSWMPQLERIVENFDPTKVKPNFRLWLSSMPTTAFPVPVLQNSVKMTMEPPKGLRANLVRSYGDFEDQYISEGNKPRELRTLIFSLCFFHAIVQERRKFGPLGWNIPYDFTTADLKCCLSQVKIFLDKYDEVPFKVITFLSGQINYGGRVTDDWDRRTLMTLLAVYITPEALNAEYRFSPSKKYYCPVEAETVAATVEFLKGLPMQSDPEVFGLHENADITYAQNEIKAMFDTILSLQARVASSAGKGREEVLEEVATDILSKLPKAIVFVDLQKQYPVMYEESMNTVLQQEVLRYNKLLNVISKSLQDFKKALKGLVVMSAQLEQMGDSLYNNQVPEMWASVAYPSLKPLSTWVVDLVHRMDFINRWIDKGVPPAYWISGFFFPQAFLTGTLQNFARKYQVSIDTVSFDFKVQDLTDEQLVQKPSDGCYIYGLYVQGARWEGGATHSLVDSRPKELFTKMAPIWLLPISGRQVPEVGIYRCPCYKILTRQGTLSTTGHSTNFVVTVEVPSNVHQDLWVKRGVALFCALAF